jgi:hypothetical protein
MHIDGWAIEGWGLHLSPEPDNVEGHPFFAANNVNDIRIGSIDDYQVLPLDPRVQVLQEAYIRAVVDAVQHLPNVLYEVANESCGGGAIDASFAGVLGASEVPEWGDSTAWQHWVIDVVRHYETEMGYDHHPIGMTMQFPVPDQSRVNDVLLDSPAEWISPGSDDNSMTNDQLLQCHCTGALETSALPCSGAVVRGRIRTCDLWVMRVAAGRAILNRLMLVAVTGGCHPLSVTNE